MTDFVFVLVVVAFFGLCVAYVKSCERLINRSTDADAQRVDPPHEEIPEDTFRPEPPPRGSSDELG